MNTEIELKYLLMGEVSSEEIVAKITALLSAKNYQVKLDEKKLLNGYFDTDNLSLRHLDMGLRVRTSTDNQGNIHTEQTIKTAGKVVGGLHQRPEYNVDIEKNFPELTLFPAKIWSDVDKVSDIQKSLTKLFTTDFTRKIWLVTIPHQNNDDSTIELVFDQGEICSGKQKEVICELELELVSGQVEDLLVLAKALFFALNIRPGLKSKAARGYALLQSAENNLPTDSLSTGNDNKLPTLELIPLQTQQNLNDTFLTGIEFSLNQLQITVDGYINQQSLIQLEKIAELLALLRQGFWLFDSYLTPQMKKLRNELSYFLKKLAWVEDACHLQELTNKTGNYRGKIQYSETLTTQLKAARKNYPSNDEIIALFHSPRFNRLQLSLLQLLLATNVLSQPENSEDVFTFAKNSLEKNLQTLVRVMPKKSTLTSLDYIHHHKLLIRSLLTGSWFGSFYDKADRLSFRNPWLDIRKGISELETMLLLQQQLALLTEPSNKISVWLECKVEHLMLTLEHSREKAISTLPYWRS